MTYRDLYFSLSRVAAAYPDPDSALCHDIHVFIRIDAESGGGLGHDPFAEHSDSPGSVHGTAVQLRRAGSALESDVVDAGVPLSRHRGVVSGPAARGRPGAHAGVIVRQLQKIQNIRIAREFKELHGQGVICNDTAGFDVTLAERAAHSLFLGGKSAGVVDVCL